MKFTGSSQDLETIISAIGRTITSSSDKDSMYQIKTAENETINLYKTNTVRHDYFVAMIFVILSGVSGSNSIF
jgi:hypothetical protein